MATREKHDAETDPHELPFWRIVRLKSTDGEFWGMPLPTTLDSIERVIEAVTPGEEPVEHEVSRIVPQEVIDGLVEDLKAVECHLDGLGRVPVLVEEMRKKLAPWTEEAYKTFILHCTVDWTVESKAEPGRVESGTSRPTLSIDAPDEAAAREKAKKLEEKRIGSEAWPCIGLRLSVGHVTVVD